MFTGYYFSIFNDNVFVGFLFMAWPPTDRPPPPESKNARTYVQPCTHNIQYKIIFKRGIFGLLKRQKLVCLFHYTVLKESKNFVTNNIGTGRACFSGTKGFVIYS
jgi:hypothetical protein